MDAFLVEAKVLHQVCSLGSFRGPTFEPWPDNEEDRRQMFWGQGGATCWVKEGFGLSRLTVFREEYDADTSVFML